MTALGAAQATTTALRTAVLTAATEHPGPADLAGLLTTTAQATGSAAHALNTFAGVAADVYAGHPGHGEHAWEVTVALTRAATDTLAAATLIGSAAHATGTPAPAAVTSLSAAVTGAAQAAAVLASEAGIRPALDFGPAAVTAAEAGETVRHLCALNATLAARAVVLPWRARLEVTGELVRATAALTRARVGLATAAAVLDSDHLTTSLLETAS